MNDAMKAKMAELEADPHYHRVDLYESEREKFGERPLDEQMIIYAGYAHVLQVMPDGTTQPMVAEYPIPDDAPVPMFSDTPRAGVLGYMCKIDFECELGGTSTVIHTSAEKALCAGTCGVVEVEIIGRKVITEENLDEMDEDAFAKYMAEVTEKVKAVDAANQ